MDPPMELHCFRGDETIYMEKSKIIKSDPFLIFRSPLPKEVFFARLGHRLL
jgi:hypothetical protein